MHLPDRTTGMPPKRELAFLIKSLSVLSNASIMYRLSMVTSSITMSDADDISSAKRLPLLTLHIESSWILRGILNCECRVLPPLRSNDALEVDAQAKQIICCDLKCASMVFNRKLFPVPGLAPINIGEELRWVTATHTALNIRI